jgi:hypothetical protein
MVQTLAVALQVVFGRLYTFFTLLVDAIVEWELNLYSLEAMFGFYKYLFRFRYLICHYLNHHAID